MAIEIEIREQLERVGQRRRQLALWLALSACWALAAALGLGILMFERRTGWSSVLVWPILALAASVAALLMWRRGRKDPIAWREVACGIEAEHPELAGRLITAVQQHADDGGRWNYLQERLAKETLEHSRRSDWTGVVPESRLRIAQVLQWCALGLFAIVLIGLGTTGGRQLFARRFAEGITVTPGDVNIERGSSLVVLARFTGALPANVELAFGGTGLSQRIALIKSLGDPMFGGSIPEVASNFTYHVEYGGHRTREFNVTVYEHPRLERADADLNFPAYTGLAPKRIENTRRLSAVEGSQLKLALRLNKPVSAARLVARDKNHTAIALAVQTNQAAADLEQFPLTASQTYDLQLVDSEGD